MMGERPGCSNAKKPRFLIERKSVLNDPMPHSFFVGGICNEAPSVLRRIFNGNGMDRDDTFIFECGIKGFIIGLAEKRAVCCKESRGAIVAVAIIEGGGRGEKLVKE